jgi:hypothetical protein
MKKLLFLSLFLPIVCFGQNKTIIYLPDAKIDSINYERRFDKMQNDSTKLLAAFKEQLKQREIKQSKYKRT